jgi:tetratricopeptide (TPR) repeat protein
MSATTRPAVAARQTPDALVGEQVAAALRSGDSAEAERVLRKRLIEAPGDADAMITLADLVTGRNSSEAMRLLYGALALAPDSHGVRLKLASLHQQRSQFPPALELLRQVPLNLRQSFEIKAQEAALLGCLGRRDEEIGIYEQLVREQPKNAGLWMSLGTALNYAGRRDQAVKALRKAIRLQPTYGEGWWSLANMKSVRFDNRDVAAMEAALRKDLAPVDALHFHFALGRAFEQRGEFEHSFEHYASGNRLRAARLKPADMRVTGFVDAAISTFTPELFNHVNGRGADSDAPIFVIGLQRSGSTLIEQILASHPDVEATAELMTMQHLADDFVALNRAGLFGAIAGADPTVFKEIGEEYLARTCAFRQLGRPRFVDKLPANWMNVGLIRLALPNARIIDARRHPMGCGFSNYKQHYATGVTFTYSLETIGHFYRDYLRLMHHFDRVQPGAVLHVLHGRLVDDPEREIRRMLDFLGLPFDPDCLQFHRNERAVHTPSAEQVRRPISREGLGLWKHYEPWLGPLKESLGPVLEAWSE